MGIMKKTDHLRHISLSVDEPDPGLFYWVLMESKDDISVWSEYKASVESYATYGKALRAGLAVLESIGDSKVGPRTSGEDENASPVGPSS